MKKRPSPKQRGDITCLNHTILLLDIDAFEPGDLDQRLEAALSRVFGGEGGEAGGNPCGQFTCTGYVP